MLHSTLYWREFGTVREAVASPEAFAVFKRDPRYTVCIYTYARKYMCMNE
jgi:hypothetical protein